MCIKSKNSAAYKHIVQCRNALKTAHKQQAAPAIAAPQPAE